MENVPCPSPDAVFSCPYWKDYMCTMPEEENCNPLYECDDYYFYVGEG